MAYSEQVVTAVTDIPALVSAFAAARGWTVAANKMTRPGGGKQFEISASIGGTNNREHRVFVTDVAVPTQRTWTQMPWANGTQANPVVQTPTKLHMFGNNTPWSEAAYISIVIECGYNAYRHIYIGNMVKFGSYTGGEVICSNYFGSATTGSAGSTKNIQSIDHKYMFSARHRAGYNYATTPIGLDSGGVNVVHANNANSWRRFHGPYSLYLATSFVGNEVFGGASDSINSGLLSRGVSDFAGSNILVPFGLYAPDSSNFGDDLRVRPLGYTPGIRMIDMRGLDPGQVIDVGGENWRVFPEFSKRTSLDSLYGTSRADGGAGGYYPIYETSGMLGLAYPEAG